MVSVVVVGAGFGGLASACYLADAGYDVTVVERNDQLGGRASIFEQDGYTFDMGPSWYLMPDVFERFFEHFGQHPSDYYELTHLDPHYRVFFKDGDSLTMSGNVSAIAETFDDYEPGAGEAFRRYLDQSADTYDVGMNQFVYTDRPKFRDYLDWDVAKNARGLGLLGSMADHVASYFDHPKLQQVVQYSLVFLGGSPTNTPALYSLMTHVDVNLGVHYPAGGMGSVVDAVAALGAELGVTYRTGFDVVSIRGKRGDFTVTSQSGETVMGDVVVSDADYAHTEQTLLAPSDRQYDAQYWESRTMAPSAFLLYLGVEGSVDPLSHHSLVLPRDWDSHFDAIFDDPAWPDDPAYYVCVPSQTDPTVAPEGGAAVFVLVPIAPGLPDNDRTRDRYRDRVLADLATNTGVDVRDRIVVENRFAVSEFADRYNAYEGSALGLAHTLRQTGPLRPDHRSSALDGLYFTGGFTRPGIGVPMCLISGEHTATAVREDTESSEKGRPTGWVSTRF